MKLLKRLKIGRRVFRVVYDRLPREHGRISFHTRTLRVDDPQPPLVRLDTTVHELLHGVWESKKLPDRITEERAVTALAQGLAQVICDNPGLLHHLEYLAKGAR